MTTIVAFRADKRRLPVGEPVTTAGQFSTLNPSGPELEAIFASVKPSSKPNRVGSLFVFESFDDAEWHWAKMAGGVLYQCEVEETAILHRGDMRLVDLAGEELRTGGDAGPHARTYWAGAGTQHPRWELLVSSATVTRVVCDDQGLRRARLAKGKRLARP